MKEKTKIGYMLITLCSVLFSTQAYCNLIKSIEVDWLSLSFSAQKMIVQNHVNALDSFRWQYLLLVAIRNRLGLAGDCKARNAWNEGKKSFKLEFGIQ